MYRRKLESLPADFTFPKSLKGMGYFVNENDQIRMIDDPELPFHYFASKNERYLERQKDAMNECISDIVMKRLDRLGMLIGRLPFGASEDEPHVPILASQNMTKAERVIVYFGETQELGTLSGRIINQESINLGSIVNFARDTLEVPPPQPLDEDEEDSKEDSDSSDGSDETEGRTYHPPQVKSKVGLVVANPGQLVWYRRGKKAVSFNGWHALPRKSAAFESMPITDANKIPDNSNAAEHTRCMFEQVLHPLIRRGIKLDIVAVNHSINDVIRVLDGDWARWKDGIAAVVCVCANVYPLEMHDENLIAFWGRRARLYILSDEPLGTPMTGRQLANCNVYSSGVGDFTESIVPRSYGEFINYFKLVDRANDYVNVPQNIPSEEEEEDGWNAEKQENVGWGFQPGSSEAQPGDEVIDVEV